MTSASPLLRSLDHIHHSLYLCIHKASSMTNIEENTNNLGEVCACDFLWDVFCAGHSMATTRSRVARHVPATPLQMSVASPISCHGCSQASSCHKNGTDRRAGVWLPAWQSASHCRVLCVCCGVACLLWLVLARCLFFYFIVFFFWCTCMGQVMHVK